MTYDLLLLAAGLALIIRGGDLFVGAAVRIAHFLKMPRVVIGSTLVSLSTTTPEMVVSVLAALAGESGLAVGNAVGSVICNIGLILGVAAVIKRVDVHPRVLRWPLLGMFGAAVALVLMSLDLRLARWQGALMVAGGVAYFVWDFWWHWRRRPPRDVAEATAIEEAVRKTRFPWFQTRTGSAVQFVGGAGIVVLGARLLVDGATGVAAALGVPSLIVGLTVVALGTSLPELVTAVASARKAVSDLAIGNVLGANIANLTLVAGVAVLLHDVALDRRTQLLSFPVMLALMALLLGMLLTARRLSRREGMVLLAAYAAYMAVLAVLTAA